MKKSFIINLFILLFVNVLIKPGWLAVDWFAQTSSQSVDGGEAYGMYFALFQLSTMFQIYFDLGISNYSNRKIAAVNSLYPSYIAHILPLRLLLSIIFFITLFFTGVILGYNVLEIKYLMVIGLNFTMLSLINYVRSNLTALGFFKWDSFVSVFDRLIMIGLVVFLFVLPQKTMTIKSFVLVQTLGYVCGVVLGLSLLFALKGFVKPKWSARFNKKLIYKCIPYAFIVILMGGYTYTDTVMLERMLGENGKIESAIYAQSYRVVQALNNYGFLISVILLPTFAGMLQRKENTLPLVRLSGTLLVFTFGLTAVIAFTNAEGIMGMLYGEFENGVPFLAKFSSVSENFLSSEKLSSVQYTSNIFVVLMLSLVPMCFNYIYGVLLTAGGKMALLNTIAAIGTVLNIVLNFIFIPKYEAYGAAVASMVTQFFIAIAQWFVASREYKFSLDVKHLLKFVVSLGVIYIVADLLTSYFEGPIRIIFITIVAFPFLFFLTGVSELKAQIIKLKANKTQ